MTMNITQACVFLCQFANLSQQYNETSIIIVCSSKNSKFSCHGEREEQVQPLFKQLISQVYSVNKRSIYCVGIIIYYDIIKS